MLFWEALYGCDLQCLMVYNILLPTYTHMVKTSAGELLIFWEHYDSTKFTEVLRKIADTNLDKAPASKSLQTKEIRLAEEEGHNIQSP